MIMDTRNARVAACGVAWWQGLKGCAFLAILAAGLLASGCDNNKDDDASDSSEPVVLEGTWIADTVSTGTLTAELDDFGYSAVLTIGTDGRFSVEIVPPDGIADLRGGVWRIEGDEIVFDCDGDGDGEGPISVVYSLSSDTLNVTTNLNSLSPKLPIMIATLSFDRI
jgi:hypothetical protein